MMFFDGKTLEVDVDEECVEMMDSVRDEIVRLVHWYRVFLNLKFTWSPLCF